MGEEDLEEYEVIEGMQMLQEVLRNRPPAARLRRLRRLRGLAVRLPLHPPRPSTVPYPLSRILPF